MTELEIYLHETLKQIQLITQVESDEKLSLIDRLCASAHTEFLKKIHDEIEAKSLVRLGGVHHNEGSE